MLEDVILGGLDTIAKKYSFAILLLSLGSLSIDASLSVFIQIS